MVSEQSYIHHAQALCQNWYIHLLFQHNWRSCSSFHLCFDLCIGSKVGAWITFLCRSQSLKKSTIHIFFRTSLPVITVPLASYWSCRLYHITGYAKHSIWSLCPNSQTAMLIPEVFFLVRADPLQDQRFLYQTISETMRLCNALSRFEYPSKWLVDDYC